MKSGRWLRSESVFLQLFTSFAPTPVVRVRAASLRPKLRTADGPSIAACGKGTEGHSLAPGSHGKRVNQPDKVVEHTFSLQSMPLLVESVILRATCPVSACSRNGQPAYQYHDLRFVRIALTVFGIVHAGAEAAAENAARRVRVRFMTPMTQTQCSHAMSASYRATACSVAALLVAAF